MNQAFVIQWQETDTISCNLCVVWCQVNKVPMNWKLVYNCRQEQTSSYIFLKEKQSVHSLNYVINVEPSCCCSFRLSETWDANVNHCTSEHLKEHVERTQRKICNNKYNTGRLSVWNHTPTYQSTYLPACLPVIYCWYDSGDGMMTLAGRRWYNDAIGMMVLRWQV